MKRLTTWVTMLAAMLLLSMPMQAASLTNLVTVTADTVSFDSSVITSVLVGVVAIAVGGGVALALGIRGAKWAWAIIRGFFGK